MLDQLGRLLVAALGSAPYVSTMRRRSETWLDVGKMRGTAMIWPRWARILVVIAVAAAVVISVPGLRLPILRAVGWALVVDEPVGPADVIVISPSARGSGVLEAADLFHRGIAKRVVIFVEPPDAEDREFIRRGIPYEDHAATATRQLTALGVNVIDRIALDYEGTEAEVRALASWCDLHQIRSVVVVCERDHSRRFRRVLLRSMNRDQTKVMVRPAHHSSFDPDRWWKTRRGIRTQAIELQKLLLDILRHPIS
jgi:hypothetical protein